MKMFVITEAELKKYEGLFFLDDDAKEDFKRIRSREVDGCIVNKTPMKTWTRSTGS